MTGLKDFTEPSGLQYVLRLPAWGNRASAPTLRYRGSLGGGPLRRQRCEQHLRREPAPHANSAPQWVDTRGGNDHAVHVALRDATKSQPGPSTTTTTTLSVIVHRIARSAQEVDSAPAFQGHRRFSQTAMPLPDGPGRERVPRTHRMSPRNTP